MIRIFDIVFSLLGLILFFPTFFIIYIIGIFDTGSPIFIQKRVGRFKKPFYLIKFRTMKLNAKSVATHLVDAHQVTRFGSFLRSSKLDELLQLINVLKGEMSIVGPRPNLYNQTRLIEERSKRCVYAVKPGITGLSQVSHIDMSTPKQLAIKDAEMIKNYSLHTYFNYIFLTLRGKGQGDKTVKKI